MMVVAAIVLVLGVLFYVLFVRAKDVPEPVPVSPTQHLEYRKHAIYENLRDLQFEYRVGKLSDEDYRQTKQALQKELAVVLAEMDAIVKQLGLTPKPVTRKSARKSGAPARPMTVCNHCGAEFSQALKFCGQCGKAIAS
jgi:rRNA maturation endonuclease Nob1